jgi:hypothetical protein
LVVKQPIPEEALKINNSTLEDRQLQTRVYETGEEMKILSSAVNVMQDLGFYY